MYPLPASTAGVSRPPLYPRNDRSSRLSVFFSISDLRRHVVVAVGVFAARCYASAAYVVMRCPSVCVCVCVCVSFAHSVEMNKHIIFKIFPSGNQAILVFPYQTAWQYCEGNAPPSLTGASNAGGVGRIRDSEPISGLITCCERCDGQLLSTRLSANIWLSIADCWS